MTALIIAGGVLLFAALVLSVRLRVVVSCREDVRATLRVLFLSFPLYPRPPKVKKEKKKKPDKKDREPEKNAPAKAKAPLTLKEKVRLLISLVRTLLRKTSKHLTLRAARIRIRVATGDAAKTALLYGAVSGALANLLALLSRVSRVRARKKDVRVFADFLGEKSEADVRLVFGIRVGAALLLLLSLAVSYLSSKRKIKAERRSAEQ